MLFTSHLLTGAVIGGVVGSPAAAGVLGVASHVAMDVVPHWGDKRPDRFLAVARVDGLAGLALGSAALLAAPRGRQVSVLAGMAGAGLLDLDKPARHFVGRSPFPPALDAWHGRIQHGKEASHRLRREVLTTLALALVTGWTLRRFQR